MIDDAIERFEAAEEGSRELDELFYQAIGWPQDVIDYGLPDATTDLQDAVDAIPGFIEYRRYVSDPSGSSIELGWWPDGLGGEYIGIEEVFEGDPCRPLCLAILKAMKAEQTDSIGQQE